MAYWRTNNLNKDKRKKNLKLRKNKKKMLPSAINHFQNGSIRFVIHFDYESLNPLVRNSKIYQHIKISSVADL